MIFKDFNTRTADLVIAAYNSSEKMKKGADYVCTGEDDQILINEALNSIEANSYNGTLPGKFAKAVLCGGFYNISDSIELPYFVSIIGIAGDRGNVSIKTPEGVICENKAMIVYSPHYKYGETIMGGYNQISNLSLSNYYNRDNNSFIYGIKHGDAGYNGRLEVINCQLMDLKTGIQIGGTADSSKLLYNTMINSSIISEGVGFDIIGSFGNSHVIGNYIRRSATGIKISNSAVRLNIMGNILRDCTTSIDKGTSTSLIVKNNQGASNSGTATVPNGATYIDVTHNVKRTPDLNEIIVTPTNNLGNAVQYWISDVGATTFRINVDADPGSSTATFVWQIP